MKKTIRDLDIIGKKVIIRCDFNVPMKNGLITDDTRIKESLPTIKYALENNAKIILMSHLGRVEKEEDKKDNSLQSVAIKLTEMLFRQVKFVNVTRGKELETAVNNLKNGEIILMENTRFEDIDGKKESKNNPELGKYWASLGEIFINDAFGTSHRAHASNVGIASNLPNGIGFLIEKELNVLMPAIQNPKRPFVVILGGSKVSDKIGVISNLVNIADYILIGGGMAYTFLSALNYGIGKSLLDIESIDFCREIIKKYPTKIIIPVDVVCAYQNMTGVETFIRDIDNIRDSEIGLDIGPKTIELFNTYLQKASTIIWNGPVGVFEIEEFAVGTKSLAEILSALDATTIIGGGDSAAAINKFGYKEQMTHISTGGGATLELLEGKELPGIAIINE